MTLTYYICLISLVPGNFNHIIYWIQEFMWTRSFRHLIYLQYVCQKGGREGKGREIFIFLDVAGMEGDTSGRENI